MTTHDLAALRTDLRVEVERVCHGAFWCGSIFRRNGANLVAVRREDGGIRFAPGAPDPTTDIGAAMALVDALERECLGGRSRRLFHAAMADCRFAIDGHSTLNTYVWWMHNCPPAKQPLVLTLAVLAARGAEWRKYLPLLEEEG